MNLKAVKAIIFVVWIIAIAVSSFIPHGKEDALLSLKLTESGIVLHFGAYFMGSALFYWSFRKDTVFSILFSCFSVFIFGVVLEFIQLYLPYRTFNPVDIAANGVGVVVFIIIWAVFKRNRITGLKEQV